MLTKEKVDKESNYPTKLELIRPALLSFTQSRVYNHSDANDVVQNTLVILSNKESTYNPSKSFYSWAFKICHFQILRLKTDRSRSKEINLELSSDSFMYYINSSCEKSPLSIFLEKEILSERDVILKKMSNSLKGKQKKLFDLSVLGKSRKEIIQIMGITSVNYSSIKSRLITRLKTLMNFK